MKMSDQYVDAVLTEAQRLLWGGSETENIEAHNLISKLIKDRTEQKNLIQGQIAWFTGVFTNPRNFDTINKTTYLERIKQMTTKREYLKAQGITVGVRGRFSGAAKIVIAEAVAKGVTFTEEKTAKAKQPIQNEGWLTRVATPPYF